MYQFDDEEPIGIAVMGATGSGKSTFINTVSGSNLQVGSGLKSCTSSIEHSRTFQLFGRNVTLIDTPGFDDTTKSDTDILKMIALYLSTTYESGYKLSGIIYMHRISDFRMTGVSRRNFSMFRKLCGDEALRNVVIVTNMWGEVTTERGAAREKELASDDILFKPVLDKGARMVRHDNTCESAQAILNLLVNKKPRVLRIQKELVEEHKDISQTAAGVELERELAALAAKHREELAQVKQEMREALLAKDMETREELDKVRGELEGSVKKIENDRERLSSEYAQEKARADEMMRNLTDKIQAEEAARVEGQAQIARMEARLRDSANESAAERARMQNEISRLQSAPRRGRGGLFGAVGGLIDHIFGF
ncbi:hypothetical protein CERSUDRAFT_125649 [Gelatoporia subvermispora B]|uniref:G domain-containing protein n=1 Tax=Ceriporiopsis subvermispora (strain B) TaxID=914234 RepID=M2PDJ6_CERS8|nr:hypothetical protein CERSUDRAFT_125649 [Gelatoporia subvermispora B]